MRAVLQSGDALLPVTQQPGVRALAADSIPLGDFSNRYTRANLQHSLISLLGHPQRPQHERECQAGQHNGWQLRLAVDPTTA